MIIWLCGSTLAYKSLGFCVATRLHKLTWLLFINFYLFKLLILVEENRNLFHLKLIRGILMSLNKDIFFCCCIFIQSFGGFVGMVQNRMDCRASRLSLVAYSTNKEMTIAAMYLHCAQNNEGGIVCLPQGNKPMLLLCVF